MPILRVILIVGCLVCLSSSSKADLIAYEGFQYPADSLLNEQSGGTGFSDNWYVDQYSYAMVASSLSDPSGTLPVSGNSLQHSGLQPRAKRNLNTVLGTTGTSVYISFLLRQDATGDFLFEDHDFGGLIIGGDTSGDFAYGVDGLYAGRGAYGSNSDKWVLGRAGQALSEVSSGVPVEIGLTAFLVVRVAFLADADEATLYVNPTPGQPEPASGAVFTGLDLGLFTQMAVTNGNNAAWTLDEIRMGTTWQDVVVPEPSACALLLIGCIALFGAGRPTRRLVLTR